MSRVCGGSSVWVLSFEQLRSQHNFTVVRNVFIIGVASACWSQRLVNVCCSSVDEILVACRYERCSRDHKTVFEWLRLELVEVDDEVVRTKMFQFKEISSAWWGLQISYVRYFSTTRLADRVFFKPSNLILIFINKGNWMYESFVLPFNTLFQNLFHMRLLKIYLFLLLLHKPSLGPSSFYPL